MARFGQLLKHHRRQLGLTQKKFALAAGFGAENGYLRVSRAERYDRATREVAQALIGVLADHGIDASALHELAASLVLTDEQRQRAPEVTVIALLVPGIGQSPFWGRVASAIEENLFGSACFAMIGQHRNDIGRQLDMVKFLGDMPALAGVIMVPAFGQREYQRKQLDELEQAISQLQQRGVPVVFLDRLLMLRRVRIPYVGLDHRYAAYIAVQTLLEAGHWPIGALIDLKHVWPQRERLEGYKQALAEAGKQYDEKLVKYGEEVSERAQEGYEREHGHRRGRTNALQLLEEQQPTAIFCATGRLALNVYEAVELYNERERRPDEDRIRIPDSLSVIGFDNLPEFDQKTPPVSRVYYDLEELGHAAVDKVLNLHDFPGEETFTQDKIIEPNRNIRGGSIRNLRGQASAL